MTHPASSTPAPSDDDLARWSAGAHHAPAHWLGANVAQQDGQDGTRFAVWAPNAQRVAVVGDFNGWDPQRHSLQARIAGIWEGFVAGAAPGQRYKYAITGADQQPLAFKADPYARATEHPPATASVIPDPTPFVWHDDDWMAGRAQAQSLQAPLSIYELHVSSWLRIQPGHACLWDTLIERLVPYVRTLGFTHIELMPIMEHPFGGSWGYQPLALLAPSARYGSPADFARFVDACHQAGIGVLLDWVPAHFPADAHGLARFDGTALYEHQDAREGWHPDWHTCIYNLGRTEVRSLLIDSALTWLQRFHVDGLRVDAVASMLYRDYSRAQGEWIPNHLGGRENLESVAFLRQLNDSVAGYCPGAITIAEESTAWPGVTAPVTEGGLGFTYKWNMGWMHDTLRYLAREPVHRRHHHHDITFGLSYAWSEHYVLALSHDEVVHGKGSLLSRLPGDDWQRHATLRASYGLLWAHPGKKLVFMGAELAQVHEWDHDGELDWNALQDPRHAGVQHLVRTLNQHYRNLPALHVGDADATGFTWVVGDDASQSVFAFLRQVPGTNDCVLVVCNFTPQVRHDYRVGVPKAGRWAERINTDDRHYGGSGVGNGSDLATIDNPAHGYPRSLSLTLPPLAMLLLQPI